jgi:Sec-independent protein secretion pathway component TatC
MSEPDKPSDELEGTEAPFVSHLIELRDRLIRALIAVGIAFGVLMPSGPARGRCTTCWPRRWWRTCRPARR